MKIAFIGWNPFQFIHAANIARKIEGAVFLIEKRKGFVEGFSESVLDELNVPYITWDKNCIKELDGVFDAFVCQTIFSQIEHIKKSKIIMLQYGLAKEPHNYGVWRSLADLNLVYGEYSKKKIEVFSPAVKIGNPRFDNFFEGKLNETKIAKIKKRLDKTKKTVLYAPTWGELSSFNVFSEKVYELTCEYNVILKLHHNTELLENISSNHISSSCINFASETDLVDLLHCSDLLISDYSGAIFDAIYVDKPVLLTQSNSDDLIGKKFDLNSLEFARRDMIGPICDNPDTLKNMVDSIIESRVSYKKTNDSLRRQLYHATKKCSKLAADAIIDACNGKYKRSQLQGYMRNHFIESRVMLFNEKRKNKNNREKEV